MGYYFLTAVYAADEGVKISEWFKPAKLVTVIGDLVNLFVPLVLVGAAIVLLIVFFIGAFRWITAGGNPADLQSAKKIISAAILGITVVGVSYILIKVISFIVDIKIPI